MSAAFLKLKQIAWTGCGLLFDIIYTGTLLNLKDTNLGIFKSYPEKACSLDRVPVRPPFVWQTRCSMHPTSHGIFRSKSSYRTHSILSLFFTFWYTKSALESVLQSVLDSIWHIVSLIRFLFTFLFCLRKVQLNFFQWISTLFFQSSINACALQTVIPAYFRQILSTHNSWVILQYGKSQILGTFSRSLSASFSLSLDLSMSP